MEQSEIIENYEYINKKEAVYIEKNNGDIRMMKEQFLLAINHYNIALNWLKLLIGVQENPVKEDETKLINEIGLPCHLNLAVCHAFLGEWSEVVYYSSKVLELDSSHRMALYYRIMGNQNLIEFEKAMSDIQILEEIRPNREIEDSFQKLKDRQLEYLRLKQNEGEIYKKMVKTYFKIQAKKECEDNKKRVKNIITKFPQAVSSLLKIWINFCLLYPFKLSWRTTVYLTNKIIVEPLIKMYSASVDIANKSYKLTHQIMAKIL